MPARVFFPGRIDLHLPFPLWNCIQGVVGNGWVQRWRRALYPAGLLEGGPRGTAGPDARCLSGGGGSRLGLHPVEMGSLLPIQENRKWLGLEGRLEITETNVVPTLKN